MYPVMDYLSSAEMLMLFGIASGVLSTFAYIPYIIDTAARRTRPQRASWLIWSVLGSIAFFSQVFEGASSSLWFAGVQVSGTIIVFVLSIWVGQGRYLSRSDHAILGAASIGLLLWYMTDNAAYALAITISISLLGGVATVVKAYNDPDSETLITWVVSFVASLCAVLSVGRLDFTLLAYPLYLFTLYLAFIVAIVLGRVRQRAGAVDNDRFDREHYLGTGSYVESNVESNAESFTDSYSEHYAYADELQQQDRYTEHLMTRDAQYYAEQQRADSFEQQAESFEQQAPSYRFVHNPSSTAFARLLSGLRTTADVIIVSAAFVFVFNWLGANSSAVDGPLSVTVPRGTAEHPAVAPGLTPAPVTLFGGADGNDVLPQPTVLTQGVIVVAVDRSGAEPVVLHDTDPLAQEARATVQYWIDNGELSAATLDSSPQLPPINPEPHRLLPSDSLRDFLVLDADDPFARLIVTSDAAMLAHRDDATPPSTQLRLLPGERLQALATNGEWYRVRVADGVQGYIHHTEVSVEILPTLSNEQTG